MVMVFFQFQLIWVNLHARSGQGQVKKGQIWKCLILKKYMFLVQTVECRRESNGAVCFSVRGLELPNIVFDCMTSPWGRGSATPMKMGGGGGDGDQAAAKPGFSSEGNPYQKPKTQRIWPTIFLKMGGIIPRTLKIGGTRPPVPPVAEPLPWGVMP